MNRVKKHWKGLLAAAVLLAVVVFVGGPYVYINFVSSPAPQELALSSSAPTAASDVAEVPVDGTWKVASGSQASYRVAEVLFGQSTTAVGRTEQVSGEITVSGTSVTAGSFSVDLNSVASDESRRDEQFRGRIMDVAQHPNATFALTDPINLGALPALGQQTAVEAKGQLTLHGTTKPVTVNLSVQRSADAIQISGSIPVVFADHGIANPSFPGVTTEDIGTIEVLLVLKHS